MWARKLALILALVIVAAVARKAFALGPPLVVTAIGGIAGSRYELRAAAAVYEATEQVAIDFNTPVGRTRCSRRLPSRLREPVGVRVMDLGNARRSAFARRPASRTTCTWRPV